MICPGCSVNTPFSLWADGRAPSTIICPWCNVVVDVDSMSVVKRGEE